MAHYKEKGDLEPGLGLLDALPQMDGTGYPGSGSACTPPLSLIP